MKAARAAVGLYDSVSMLLEHLDNECADRGFVIDNEHCFPFASLHIQCNCRLFNPVNPRS